VWLGLALITCAPACLLLGQQSLAPQNSTDSAPITIQPNWRSIVGHSHTQITLQVVVNPPLRRGSPIHDAAWGAMRQLDAVDARFAMWYPYPRLGVAELQPPSHDRTSWDFSLMDPLLEDFFYSTSGRPSVLTISTIPQWMFTAPSPATIPGNADEAVWDYEQGYKLRDDSLDEVSAYFERVARWYIRGQFVDELGKAHISGHHYDVRYWEILNEPEFEHNTSPEYYTRIYDAVVSRLHRVSPQLKFVGMSSAEPAKGLHFFEYFLDASHHVPGVPLDAISYHFYALGHPGESEAEMASSLFAQTDHFIDTVDKAETIRNRLSPTTETHINEAGCIAAVDVAKTADSMSGKDIGASYWNLCGATFAYLYGHVARKGINVLGASQLVGYPSQYPSVSLLNWNDGSPNPRYRVLQLLMNHCHRGDNFVSNTGGNSHIYSIAFLTAHGQRKLMLVNKSSNDEMLILPGAIGGQEEHVDILSLNSPAVLKRISSSEVTLHGFSVMIVTYPANSNLTHQRP
jgi:hypothetical protein